jgi:hypothetical protein
VTCPQWSSILQVLLISLAINQDFIEYRARKAYAVLDTPLSLKDGVVAGSEDEDTYEERNPLIEWMLTQFRRPKNICITCTETVETDEN